MRIAILASGNGSNFEAIVQEFQKRDTSGEIVLLFSDNPRAYVLERAKRVGIAYESCQPSAFSTKQLYERYVKQLLETYKVDLIVLAGYMRMIGSDLLEAFPNRILNIHPSLLPSFPGLHGIQDAFNYGVKVTGITIHYIDAGVDTGPIIHQATVLIEKNQTVEALEARIHELEHYWYPKIIAQIVKGGESDR